MRPALQRIPLVVLLSALLTAPLVGQTTRPERLVAIGDIHGDLNAAKQALTLAEAINDQGTWIGGRLVVVQTGDIFDRGDSEPELLTLFDRLAEEARAAGGAVHLLNGNHELMNVYFDFRYVTDAGFRAFANTQAPPSFTLPDKVTDTQRGRALAFRPGGPIATSLAKRPTMMVLDGNAFVHGGILPAHAKRGIDGMNAEVQRWLRGEGSQPEWIKGDESPVWTRLYSKEPDAKACASARETLELLGAKRMVVGHSVHKQGITSYCNGAVWAIDVGMSKYYGGPTQVLELRGDSVRILGTVKKKK